MADPHARSRRSAGQPGGGEFAPEAKGAPYGLSLSETVPDHAAAGPDLDDPGSLDPEQVDTMQRLAADTPPSLRDALYRTLDYRPTGALPAVDDARCALANRALVDREVPGWDTEAYAALSRPWRQATGQPLHPDDPDNLDLTSASSSDADGIADHFWPSGDRPTTTSPHLAHLYDRLPT